MSSHYVDLEKIREATDSLSSLVKKHSDLLNQTPNGGDHYIDYNLKVLEIASNALSKLINRN